MRDFLILGRYRTGTTRLFELLKRDYELNGQTIYPKEYFVPPNAAAYYDLDGKDKLFMADDTNQFDVAKVLLFQIRKYGPTFLDDLLCRYKTVIYLHRRDVFEQALSFCIAKQLTEKYKKNQWKVLAHEEPILEELTINPVAFKEFYDRYVLTLGMEATIRNHPGVIVAEYEDQWSLQPIELLASVGRITANPVSEVVKKTTTLDAKMQIVKNIDQLYEVADRYGKFATKL